MPKDDTVLQVELKNSRPIELVDLTASFTALAESFRDYSNATVGDPKQDNLRLYVQEIKSGSVIATLVALAEQTQFIAENAEVFAGFIANCNDLANYFLGKPKPGQPEPTVREAKQIAQIVEPVAKDSGAQLNITAMDGGVVNVHNHFHVAPVEANAIQNGVARFLGPQLPSSQFMSDQLMVLEQVKNNATAKSGDRGIIEALSSKAVKLQFASEEVKRKVLDLHENPLQCVFQVNVEVRSAGGRVAQYRILEVTDVIHPDT